MTVSDAENELQVERTLFDLLKGRAVRSARLSVETLCESETLPGADGGIAWDTQRLQACHADVELVVLDLLDLHDALVCLDRLQLLARPIAQRPHLVVFLAEVDAYALRAVEPSQRLGMH